MILGKIDIPPSMFPHIKYWFLPSACPAVENAAEPKTILDA
jgi:hypothetical protein